MPDLNTACLPGSRSPGAGALIVNIFGGPGSGKSTLASGLFQAMKQSHIEAACPEEHAKLALWSGQDWILDHQPILLGRSWETTQALFDKVEVVIVDSPILLCSVYAGQREPGCFHELALDLHRRTDRLNLVLPRRPDIGYSTNGRRESASEALRVDADITALLDRCEEAYVLTDGQDDLPQALAACILARRPPLAAE